VGTPTASDNCSSVNVAGVQQRPAARGSVSGDDDDHLDRDRRPDNSATATQTASESAAAGFRNDISESVVAMAANHKIIDVTIDYSVLAVAARRSAPSPASRATSR
jgi:hypothetical protein